MVYPLSWSSAQPLLGGNGGIRNVLLVVSCCHRSTLFLLCSSTWRCLLSLFPQILRLSWPWVAYSEWWQLSNLFSVQWSLYFVKLWLWKNQNSNTSFVPLFLYIWFAKYVSPHIWFVSSWPKGTIWVITVILYLSFALEMLFEKKKGGFMRKLFILTIHLLFLAVTCIFNIKCNDEGLSQSN